MARLRAVASRSFAPDPGPVPSEPTPADKPQTSAVDSMGWITLSMGAGFVAAINGVFAKLSTNELTEKMVLVAAEMLGLTTGIKYFEILLRVVCFVLNMVCNGIMWSLFTRSLAACTSTTQASVINSSTNFMATALFGFVIFSEALPPLWFLGAAMLIVGNVIIGRQDEDAAERAIVLDPSSEAEATPLQAFHDEEDLENGRYRDEADVDEDVPHIEGITLHQHQL